MSGRDFDKIADPELIARLASWFGEGPLPPADPDHIEAEARKHAMAELEAVVDRELQAKLEARRGAASALLVWAKTPLETRVDVNLPRARVRLAPIEHGEPIEYEQPDDIRFALKDYNTPQSVLRDLFRPVRYFGDVAYRREASPGSEVLDPTSAARDAMRTPLGVAAVSSALTSIDHDLGDLRRRLCEPWEDAALDPSGHEDDDDPSDHYRWFGLEGGYDPDL